LFDPAEASRNAAERARAAAAIAAVLEAAGVGGADGLAKVGHVLHGRIVATLSTPGTGRLYRRGGRLHRASAPGQPPAVDTGRYRQSWWVDHRREGPDTWSVEVGTKDRRGPWLEYGTRHMAPRPHLRPAVLGALRDIVRMIADGVTDAERRKSRERGGRG
jgi:hypothetical protein